MRLQEEQNQSHVPVALTYRGGDRKQLEIRGSVSGGSLRSQAKGRKLSPEGGAKSRLPREPVMKPGVSE